MKIVVNAAGPAETSGDAGSVEQHKLTNPNASDRQLVTQKAANEHQPQASGQRACAAFGRVIFPYIAIQAAAREDRMEQCRYKLLVANYRAIAWPESPRTRVIGLLS